LFNDFAGRLGKAAERKNQATYYKERGYLSFHLGIYYLINLQTGHLTAYFLFTVSRSG
jgi:hypothetical protein